MGIAMIQACLSATSVGVGTFMVFSGRVHAQPEITATLFAIAVFTALMAVIAVGQVIKK